ncbi:DMT family transporter [uncultured Litoreibacter sp.]|uniref:DMT family transporter n=1 Tax=uncultured Litoreibacter sp. TaxID=1392394 RepID=UPI00345ABB02
MPSATDASNPVRAATWMIGAIASFSAMAVAGRAVSAELDTFELMMYRSFIGIALVVGISGALGKLNDISTQNMPLHLARNISHFAGQNFWFAAITMIPLAQVIALEFTSPIWIALLAPIFLAEKLTRLRLLVASLGFAGAMIVARPDFSNVEPGVIFAAAAAIGFAGSAIFTKILTRTEPIISILFWLTVMQAVFGVICSAIDGDVAIPSVAIMPWVGVVAITGLAAHFCLTTALSYAPATIVMPFDFARLPVIALIGVWLYSEPLEWPVLLGACIIFGANYLNISAESRRNRALR